MVPDATPPPTVALGARAELSSCGRALWPRTDAVLALSLFATWAACTGRTLRAVPVTELTSEELIDFWADDQLEQLPDASGHQRT